MQLCGVPLSATVTVWDPGGVSRNADASISVRLRSSCNKSSVRRLLLSIVSPVSLFNSVFDGCTEFLHLRAKLSRLRSRFYWAFIFLLDLVKLPLRGGSLGRTESTWMAGVFSAELSGWSLSLLLRLLSSDWPLCSACPGSSVGGIHRNPLINFGSWLTVCFYTFPMGFHSCWRAETVIPKSHRTEIEWDMNMVK